MGSLHLHRLTGIDLEPVEAKQLESGRRYYVRTLRIMGPGESEMEINLFADKKAALMTAEELQAEEENKEELAKSAFRREMLAAPTEVNGAVERMLDHPIGCPCESPRCVAELEKIMADGDDEVYEASSTVPGAMMPLG